jgi:AcrR family transcriptional regulator
MKISKSEKEQVHRRILESAVQVISKNGFRDATMRDIAQHAKIGDATIYKYFPTKEDILHGYFRANMEELIDRIRNLPDFNEYKFQEQLHLLLETHLEILEKDRAFVQIAYENVFSSNWLHAGTSSQGTKDRFFEVAEDLLTSAIEAGEIPEPPFKKFLYELYWEYMIAVTYYWLKDESEKHQNTTQLIDRTLDLAMACLQSGLLGKAADLGHFLIREHLLSRIKNFKTGASGKRNYPSEIISASWNRNR